MSHGIIPLTQGKVAIVDTKYVSYLRKFSWRAVRHKRSWYAKTTVMRYGKQVDISMHRLIAQTPKELVCHHLNGNSLDNRRANLLNMTKRGHTLHHAHNKILVKYAEKYADKNSLPELPFLCPVLSTVQQPLTT